MILFSRQSNLEVNISNSIAYPKKKSVLAFIFCFRVYPLPHCKWMASLYIFCLLNIGLNENNKRLNENFIIAKVFIDSAAVSDYNKWILVGNLVLSGGIE